MYCRRARKKPFLTKVHIARRKAWAEGLQTWTMADWSKIIWTDEMSFEIGKDSRVTRVWREAGEEYAPKNLALTFKSGRASLMVWGCIAFGMRGLLVRMLKGGHNTLNYIANILNRPLEKFYLEVKAARGDAYVVEDGAPVHTAKVSQKWREDHAIKTFPHPSRSPDLNAIEHVWSQLKNNVNNRLVRPRSVEEAEAALFEEWEKLDLGFINSLANSMPDRVKAVLEAGGRSTKY